MKRTVIITLIFSLISSLSTYLLFHSMEGFKSEIKESKFVVKEMKEQINSIEENYKSEMERWMEKSFVLQNQIAKTDSNLTLSKQKEKSLQGKIQKLISESKEMQDTSAIISNYDSVKTQTEKFISETFIRDSLCDKEISELKCLAEQKDSAMAVCQSSFSALKQLADSSISFQNKLTDELASANKKIKKANLKSKFLTAGVMVLSGATTFLLLQK